MDIISMGTYFTISIQVYIYIIYSIYLYIMIVVGICIVRHSHYLNFVFTVIIYFLRVPLSGKYTLTKRQTTMYCESTPNVPLDICCDQKVGKLSFMGNCNYYECICGFPKIADLSYIIIFIYMCVYSQIIVEIEKLHRTNTSFANDFNCMIIFVNEHIIYCYLIFYFDILISFFFIHIDKVEHVNIAR